MVVPILFMCLHAHTLKFKIGRHQWQTTQQLICWYVIYILQHCAVDITSVSTVVRECIKANTVVYSL